MTPQEQSPPSRDPLVAQEQREAVAFLTALPSGDGTPVERIDTHISHVFLAGDRAYKLKRAVRTNFLDFSTLPLREQACRREVEVNAVVASALYLGVRPITRQAGGLAIGGDGPVVDWLVAMHRFKRHHQFNVLAETGALGLAEIEPLADIVAEMHAKAPQTPEYGGAARVLATIRQIAGGILEAQRGAELAGDVAAWRARAEAEHADRARQLDARRRHGFVRRCHGDLHLGNVCLFRGRPIPFDALEFNEEMASTDVFYDVAFTVMDLIERGLKPLANAFLNRYLGATRDYSGLALMPLFVSMRAAVRSLVAASVPVPDPRAPSARERLEFALESLSAPASPQLIAIGGLSGSGKSTIARRIAPEIGSGAGAIVLRSDVIRKRLFGTAPEDRLPEAAYRPEVSRRVYNQMARDARRALAAGATVILDATFLSTSERRHMDRSAELAGVGFVGIWLDCPAGELRLRISGRGRDASDADLAVLERQLTRDPGPGDWTTVPATGTPDEVAAALRAALSPAA